MSTDLDRAYDELGVKPGISVRELKAAHRDLAKVWHPDRFVHDPGLREKAQEKLKQINAAYELLISGKVPQPRPQPPPVYATQSKQRQSRQRRSHGFGLALLMFMAVFAVTVSLLLQKPQKRALAVDIATENAEEISASPDENVSRSRQPKAVGSTGAAESMPVVPRVQPLATVTVVIDPHTGLRATTNCPQTTSMTYPSGNEPHAYCNARHPPKVTATPIEGEPQKRQTH